MTKPSGLSIHARMLSDFIRLRGPAFLVASEVDRLRVCLVDMTRRGLLPARPGMSVDWPAIARLCAIEEQALLSAAGGMQADLEALWRRADKAQRRAQAQIAYRRAEGRGAPSASHTRAVVQQRRQQRSARTTTGPAAAKAEALRDFATALAGAMDRHGETAPGLQRALRQQGQNVRASTLRQWRQGRASPSRCSSLRTLECLEGRWGLPAGYFQNRLPQPNRAPERGPIASLSACDRRRAAWHLPEDFDERPPAAREEILDWVRRTVLGGTTDYSRYQSAARQQPYGLTFGAPRTAGIEEPRRGYGAANPARNTLAPAGLNDELRALFAFKSAPLTPVGFERHGVWSAETLAQKTKHFSLLFGALAGDPGRPLRGRGIPLSSLTFGLLVFPQVWDWYLAWRQERRGFLTVWEVDMLFVAVALTKARTGWLTQTPALAQALRPIEGLITEDDIACARADWPQACARLHAYGLSRARETDRLRRVHRDPFEPIHVVLEAASPVGEYRKIADEILALRPCAKTFPKAAAENVRAYLMIRLALHLGWRQRNLRELLFCQRGDRPRSDRHLAALGRGELRWSERDGGWEAYAPPSAFKNAGSSYFSGEPFRLLLPDIGGLYGEIGAYLKTHRPRLLGHVTDCGAFFVKSARTGAAVGGYDQKGFYEAWRWIILRYGIYNPYTGRGAIAGLLPHGPHRVRDVLATHVLKQTGSFEQASFVIQDTPKTIAQHYARFRPQDKAAIAAEIVNRAWDG